MRLNKIALENFRNYKQAEVKINSDLVLVLGDNASGKTNFLESIYYLSRLKSFRAPDNLLAKYQEDHFSLKATLDQKKMDVTIQVSPALKRQYKIDDIKTKRLLWQSFASVLFVPNDLNLFHLGPILRRKFMDETISQTDQTYSLDLESLDHILKQKSALLEQIYKGQAKAEDLEFWNLQLAPIAFRITSKRQMFIDFLNEKITSKTSELTGFSNNIKILYKRIVSNTEENLLQDLKDQHDSEIRSGKNLIGPHRDDFEIYKDDQLNLFNSSRGELRCQILALKLLQAQYLDQNGKTPIILLDDVFSELDEIRRTKLLENLKGHQIFITSTEEHHLPKLAKDAQILKVENNQIK